MLNPSSSAMAYLDYSLFHNLIEFLPAELCAPCLCCSHHYVGGTAFEFIGDGSYSPKKCLRHFTSLQQGLELQKVFGVRAVLRSFENSHTPLPDSNSWIQETKGKQISDKREQGDPCQAFWMLLLAPNTSFLFTLDMRLWGEQCPSCPLGKSFWHISGIGPASPTRCSAMLEPQWALLLDNGTIMGPQRF